MTAGDAEVDAPEGGHGLVDWRRLARRLWLLALTWAGLGVLGAAVATLPRGAAGAGALWAGVAALGLLASVIGTVALSALGGMLRAGERRERLAGGDVGLLPPQVRTRLREERGQGRDGPP
ncbi:MAG: hypothetical protein ABR592_04360 [Nitriliruptorales bacterium]